MPIIPLAYQHDSTSLFRAIRHLPFACWLDSGKPKSHSGRYDIITAAPERYWIHKGKTTQCFNEQGQALESIDTAPLELLKQACEQLMRESHELQDQDLPFYGGIITCASYNLGREQYGITQQSESPCQLPDLYAGLYAWAIVQDHELQTCWLSALPSYSHTKLDAIAQLIEQNVASTDNNAEFSIGELTSNTHEQSYHEKLDCIDDYIHAGDCYQVNFAQCFSAKYQGDPFTAYTHLRHTMASPFSAYIQLGEQAILSLSPERFLEVRGNQVLTQPIKGTVARDSDSYIDKHNADSLQNSTKNRAENLMIVDLLRNDLGKSCVPGSIKVPELFTLESFPNVHHLVSNVTGTVAPDKLSMDIFKDCFPGGSITGAPKKRAMEIIEELENCQRSIYCGSIAYVNANGDLDSNITIRTIACDGERLYCWGGGGIVSDSDTDEEYQESLTKIGAILEVLKQFQR